MGLINASRGLAYNVQIQIINLPIDPSLNAELQDKLVTRAHARVLEPGTWKADISLRDLRLEPASVEIYFRDQAMNEWNRDERVGILAPAADGPLFWATLPDTEDDKHRRELEGPHSIPQQELRLVPVASPT